LIQANTDFHPRLAKTTRSRELVELLTRNLEKTERLMYIEPRCSRFPDTEFQMLHGRIVDALRARDAEGVREAVVNDITEAQRATLSFGRNWPSALLPGAAIRLKSPNQSRSGRRPSVLRKSTRVRFTGADYTDLVIGKEIMRTGKIVFRHVAIDTVRGAG
jgi:hypothetical protein